MLSASELSLLVIAGLATPTPTTAANTELAPSVLA